MHSERYKNDGSALLDLNPLQLRIKKQINDKIVSNEYVFETFPCPVCDSVESDDLAEKDRYGLYFPVVICRNCGMVYTNPRMTADSYASFYNCEYRQLYHGEDVPAKSLYEEQVSVSGPRVARLLEELGFAPHGKRVLEVGCGAGGILTHIRDSYGCEVVGCDYGRDALEYGKREGGLDIREGSLADIELPWKAQVIIYSHVFEHIMDPEAECRMIRDSLADDGIVYVEIPSIKNIKWAYKSDFLRLLQNAHTFHFTQRTLRNVFQRHGFDCLAGNELSACIFKYTGNVKKFVSDYAAVMDYLREAEEKRIQESERLWRFKKGIKRRLKRVFSIIFKK